MRSTRHQLGRSGAFTLVELLVAVAILSAVFALVASLWGQGSGWNSDIERQSDGLRLQRVLTMMKDQWSNRRMSVPLGSDKVPVVVTDGQLSFTTATPILFPDWPLVVATYRFEQEREFDRVGLWRVVYEESRVSSAPVESADLAISETNWEGGRDPRGRPLRARTVLIDGLSSLGVERFGPSAAGDETIPEKRRSLAESENGTAAGSGQSERDKQLADRDQARSARKKAETAAAEAGAEDDAEAALTDSEKEARRARWRPMEVGGYLGLVPSVRVVGEVDKERFACVFVILASR